MPSKHNTKKLVMYSKSDKIKIMINGKADELIQELFQAVLSRYQIGLETFIKGSDFVFGCVHLLYSKCHKIVSNWGRS